MAEPKTRKTQASVSDFLAGVADPVRRADAQALCDLMTEQTRQQPAMWGGSIIGFGSYSYSDRGGRENTWPAVGFSPRKQSLTLYISAGLDGYGRLLDRIGRHTTGKGCVYLPRLSEVDLDVLRELVRSGFGDMNGRSVTPGVG